MFQQRLLKGALAACAILEAIEAMTTSSEDLGAYPEFDAAMQNAGEYLQWQSYPVKSADGYDLLLFRLTADSLGVPLTNTKGPVLLKHGVFSDSLDWLNRLDTESSDAAVAVQLAKAGHDVWIASGRGRQFTKPRSANSPADVQRVDFWDYSFQEIGEYDVPAMVDEIIRVRSETSCDKVTVIAHGSGANSAVVAAARAD